MCTYVTYVSLWHLCNTSRPALTGGLGLQLQFGYCWVSYCQPLCNGTLVCCELFAGVPQRSEGPLEDV